MQFSSPKPGNGDDVGYVQFTTPASVSSNRCAFRSARRLANGAVFCGVWRSGDSFALLRKDRGEDLGSWRRTPSWVIWLNSMT